MDKAYGIVKNKIFPQDRSSELPYRLRSKQISRWSIKASGELAQEGVQQWLTNCDSNRPFFIFLNYMEAHRPYLPSMFHRNRLMNEDQVKKSFEIDRSWLPMWFYTFGLSEYSEEELKITNLTYDATLSDLDDLFKSLVTTLENSGHLDDTVVILTSDHGEHLGEQHMLDHQYTIYEAVSRVPLIVWYPKLFTPGRDSRPVMNFDIFPTLLELAGVELNERFKTLAVSLTHPENQPHSYV